MNMNILLGFLKRLFNKRMNIFIYIHSLVERTPSSAILSTQNLTQNWWSIFVWEPSAIFLLCNIAQLKFIFCKFSNEISSIKKFLSNLFFPFSSTQKGKLGFKKYIKTKYYSTLRRKTGITKYNKVLISCKFKLFIAFLQFVTLIVMLLSDVNWPLNCYRHRSLIWKIECHQ